MILKKGLDIHRSKVPETLQPFHNHMESRYQEMKIVLEREYGIKVSWLYAHACFFVRKYVMLLFITVLVLVTASERVYWLKWQKV